MLQVVLVCPFLIAPLVSLYVAIFSGLCCIFALFLSVFSALCCHFLWIVLCFCFVSLSLVYPMYKAKTQHNPEKLAT
jgi:hypothetical protein